MPTNLSALPSNLPIPNGRVQFKHGQADTAPSMTQANAGQLLSDGAGGYMQIAYTPTYPCWWLVRGNVMTHGIDGAWCRCDYGIDISPADANGVTRGHQTCMQTYPNSTVEWHTYASSAMFRLNAGIAYTASLSWVYSYSNTQQYHTGPNWLRIIGRIIGEGAI